MKQFALLCLLSCQIALAQTGAIDLLFKPLAHKRLLRAQDTMQLKGGEQIVLESLKFYVSAIQLYSKGRLVWSEKDSYHLYDIGNPQAFVLHPPASLRYDRITFTIGVDSLVNVAGAMGGALDPTQGMYWTWQSGYINFKAEGWSSASPHPRKEFQLHLGGYKQPYATCRQISLSVPAKRAVSVRLDVSRFMEAAAISQHSHVMSPGAEASHLSDILASCFELSKP